MRKPANQVVVYVALCIFCLLGVIWIFKLGLKPKRVPVPPRNLGELNDSVRAGMSGNWSAKEAPINLQDYINANLKDPLDAPQTDLDNNLIQLPEGLHKFGGVPFEVSGTIQLAGTALPAGVKSLPTQV